MKVVKQQEITVGQPGVGFMSLNTLEQAMKVSEIIAKSQFCPKQFQGKSGDVLIAMQIGVELGIKPMQALQNIAVINGRPSLWGDAVLAVCRQSPEWEYIEESLDTSSMTATCKVKRKNEPEIVEEFSQEDAKKAGLWGKQGPWTCYPKRMLQMRARSFALRNAFADCLRGIQTREEAVDMKDIKDVSDGGISFDQVDELCELANRANINDDDLCKGAKVDTVEGLLDLGFGDYKNLRHRLMKRVKQVEGEAALKELVAGEKVAPINRETGEIID